MMTASSYELKDILDELSGNILLINPPIIDSRYPWSKWNQPNQLLKLGAFLQRTRDCKVRLFDFLLPNPSGRIPKLKSPIKDSLDENVPTRFWFGKPRKIFDKYIDDLLLEGWYPDYVVLDTLTSFWWEAIPLIGNSIKNRSPEARIILLGNYPKYEYEHALTSCPYIDVIVPSSFDLSLEHPDLMLYKEDTPRFLALDIRTPDTVIEIENALEKGISRFIFFNENIFSDFNTYLKPTLEDIVARELDIRFHAICGVEIEHFPFSSIDLLKQINFSGIHIEPVVNEQGEIIEDIYKEFFKACEKIGLVDPVGKGWKSTSRINLSGFVWIGKPDDQMETIVWNILKVLQLTGMVIPKPVSPTPGSIEHSLFCESRDGYLPQDISPHRMPFANSNGIGYDEYKDLYRLTAILNYKVRSRTFDFLGDSYLVQVIKESFKGERWAI